MKQYSYQLASGTVTTTFKNGRLISVRTPYMESIPAKKTVLRWLQQEIKELIK